MYRANDQLWPEREKQAIQSFAASFEPERVISDEKYSEWHYLVLKGSAREDLGKPIVVLMDQKCFSATDIFLSALKGLPNVTLIGTASSGGSSFTQTVELGYSGIELRLGSMISFQSDGRLYDTNGVQPDIHVEPNADYFLGKSDPQLDFAIGFLKQINLTIN
ncbi:hypothetical protein JD969_09740 [Planctomycetota bacterium]|nr:hypothetical protein JD969_09740 [Planctomycetota bacterium]